MQLTLEGISKKVGPQSWLYAMALAPRNGALALLLDGTQAGKTSLRRILAGLDAPSSERLSVDGKSVVGVPVRERNVSMVYHPFINYPSRKVRDNMASPLKVRGESPIEQHVRELA
jgi:glycerol transport system ATP-binding protein